MTAERPHYTTSRIRLTGGGVMENCVVAFYRAHDAGDLELLGRASADVWHGKFASGTRSGLWADAAIDGDARGLAQRITESRRSDAYLAWGETLLRIQTTEWSSRHMRVSATQQVPVPLSPQHYRAARLHRPGVAIPEIFGIEPSPPRSTSEWYEDEKVRVYREILGHVEPGGLAS